MYESSSEMLLVIWNTFQVSNLTRSPQGRELLRPPPRILGYTYVQNIISHPHALILQVVMNMTTFRLTLQHFPSLSRLPWIIKCGFTTVTEPSCITKTTFIGRQWSTTVTVASFRSNCTTKTVRWVLYSPPTTASSPTPRGSARSCPRRRTGFLWISTIRTGRPLTSMEATATVLGEEILGRTRY